MSILRRSLNPLQSQSFFLFGPRGVGKTSLLENLQFLRERVLWIDLLKAQVEREFSLNPQRLEERLASNAFDWVVIDEVQKIPALLDVVHDRIEHTKIRFALSGSSARKLKRGAANLLAGRAFVYHLFPFTHQELGEHFSLGNALQWGMLPKMLSLATDEERDLYLESYVETYLREEVIAEQLVRNLTPFRRFLEVAAQSSGMIINYSSIAQDIGVDANTVKSYFGILEDTLIGCILPAWDRSVRKQQIKAPRFYLFDYGVKRALERVAHIPIGSSAEFGRAFEHFIFNEMRTFNHYQRLHYKFSHLLTKGGLEVDIVIDRPGMKTALVEIKSAETVEVRHLEHLSSLRKDYGDFDYYCLCREKVARLVEGIHVLPWIQGLNELGFT